MKNKLLLVAVLVLALLTIGARFAPTTYEYRFEYSPSETACNNRGSVGWELVGIQSGGAGVDGSASVYVFKRAK